jgi:dihydrofolate synthase/folylpolyglutamate synthase
MNYSLTEWLNWLGQFPLDTGDTAGKEFSQTLSFAKQLGVTQFSCPVITIAGTNGKGSCAATLEAIFLAAGYRVGVITSPDLMYFNERFRLQGKPIQSEKICEAFAKIQSLANHSHYPVLSFYRFIHLALIWLAHQEALDICILEVGMGGSFDTINVVDTDLAIITSIELDHMEFLGNTREAIAQQKAGIMRSYKPVICGDPHPPACLEKIAQAQHSDFYQLGKIFKFIDQGEEWEFLYLNDQIEHLPKPIVFLENSAISLMAVKLLSSVLPVNIHQILEGLKTIQLHGRCELISQSPHILLDVSHNPAGVIALHKKMQEFNIMGRKRAVFGVMKDKDVASIISVMKDEITDWYLVDLPEIVRAANSREIAAYLEPGSIRYQGLAGLCYQQALQDVVPEDMIIVFGSFHVVGSVLRYIKGLEENIWKKS